MRLGALSGARGIWDAARVMIAILVIAGIVYVYNGSNTDFASSNVVPAGDE